MQRRILLSFYLMLGFVFQFPSVAMRFWMIETVKLTPAQMMAMGGISGIPWCLKPVYGFISDSYPIFGYKRMPYVLIGCFLTTLSYWTMPWYSKNIEIVCMLMFTGSLGLCISDVVCDSILVSYARNENAANTGNIQSWCWGLRAIGGLLASIGGGIAYSCVGAELVMVLTGCFPLVIAILFLAIKESAVETPTSAKKTGAKLLKALKKENIYKPALFLFIISVTPGFDGATTYYFENVLKFTPFEFSMLDTMAYVTSITGTIVYRKYLTKVPFRKIFFWTLALSWLLKWSYMLIITNAGEYIGIPNIAIAMADSIIFSLLGQFLLLPTVVLAAKICPVGVEGSLYALLMSISNLAGVLSSEWGSIFANMYGIDRNHFENLWKLIILCNVIDLLPIASIALVVEPAPINVPSEEHNGFKKLQTTI